MTLATAAESGLDWLRDRAEGPMPEGCVLVHAPSSAMQAPGGGENQLVQTSRHLDAMGVPIRPFSPWADRLERARLLHLYGMSREGLELARVARARGVPVAVSPICWFEPRALAALAPSAARAAFDLAKWATRRVAPALPDWRRELLAIAGAILPNSEAEADQLVGLFGADRRKVVAVPNGVDPRFAEADPSAFRARFGTGDFVLYAGRIEPRKNVLGLARAAAIAGLPLVAIGGAVPGHEGYAEACRRAAGPSARFLPAMVHEDPMLASAAAAARVFALPSWFETPGLAALEAALAGCAIVITPHGCTREYFGDRAIYARPGDDRAIAGALQAAWSEGPRPGLADRVRERFPWSAAALATKEAYDRLAP